MSKRSSYIHGTDPQEQRRLSLLNDRLNAASLREIGILPGERILDLGSGLGQLTRAMAAASGESGRAVGIDFSADQVEEAKRIARDANEERRVEFRVGDASSPPLREEEWGTFDVAHARFLLEHVPAPQQVVSEMARAVHPGGRVVLADDDHEALRLWPEPAGVGAVWRAYIRTYDRLGNDPHIGRRLVQLLADAGLQPRRIALLPFGACAGDPALPAYVANLGDVFMGARDAILATGGVTAAEFDDAQAALRAWGERRDAAFWYSISWAEAVKP